MNEAITARRAPCTADLGMGPTVFPKGTGGGAILLAFAPLRDPAGVPYTEDEVVMFTDHAFEPDGSERSVGTGPAQ